MAALGSAAMPCGLLTTAGGATGSRGGLGRWGVGRYCATSCSAMEALPKYSGMSPSPWMAGLCLGLGVHLRRSSCPSSRRRVQRQWGRREEGRKVGYSNKFKSAQEWNFKRRMRNNPYMATGELGGRRSKADLEARIDGRGRSRRNRSMAEIENEKDAVIMDDTEERFRLEKDGQIELKKYERKTMNAWRAKPNPEELPATFKHWRRAHDWAQILAKATNSTEDEIVREASADHFFSKNGWPQVRGASKDLLNAVKRIGLRRPSRVQNKAFYPTIRGDHCVIAEFAGAGKTLAYMLPLLQRYILDSDPEDDKAKVIVIAPTSDLAVQIANVARVVSFQTERKFMVQCITNTESPGIQGKALRRGASLMVFTPGRLKFFLSEDTRQSLDVSDVRAVVLDEVDQLLQEGTLFTIDELRGVFNPSSVQYLFVTATLGPDVTSQLQDFETLPGVTPRRAPGQPAPTRGVAWLKGAGLHRASPTCDHVLCDATPDWLDEMDDRDDKYEMVLQQKLRALIWHLKKGLLSKVEEDRILIFCNSIPICRQVENSLRKAAPKLRSTGGKAWKMFTMHSERSKDEYARLMAEFNDDKVSAKDWMKKKIMICTDRLSRGVDFSEKEVFWVVLFDWPRDATEYIRRVGRTARGGKTGQVLSILCNRRDVKMAKLITSGAVRGDRLEAENPDLLREDLVLERFDPTFRDWRAPEAVIKRFEDGTETDEGPEYDVWGRTRQEREEAEERRQGRTSYDKAQRELEQEREAMFRGGKFDEEYDQKRFGKARDVRRQENEETRVRQEMKKEDELLGGGTGYGMGLDDDAMYDGMFDEDVAVTDGQYGVDLTDDPQRFAGNWDKDDVERERREQERNGSRRDR